MKNEYINGSLSYFFRPRIHGNVLAWNRPASKPEGSRQVTENIMRWEDDGGPVSEAAAPLPRVGETNTARLIETLEMAIQLDANASTIEGMSFNKFSVAAEGLNGVISTDVVFTSLKTQGRSSTEFDYTDSTAAKYNFDIFLSGFNINDFAKESGINSE